MTKCWMCDEPASGNVCPACDKALTQSILDGPLPDFRSPESPRTRRPRVQALTATQARALVEAAFDPSRTAAEKVATWYDGEFSWPA